MTNELDVGRTLSAIFDIYRDQAAVLLPVAAAIFVGEAILAGLLFAASPALIIVAILVQIVAITLYSGMVVELVHDVQDGRRDHSVGELFRAVTGAVVPLILAGLLVGLMVAVGLILLIVPGLILLTIFAVVAPAIVLERRGVIESLGRSRALVKGDGFRVFGVIFVLFLLGFVVSALLGGLGAGAGTGGRIVADFIASTITAPLSGLAAAVIYFELLRLRDEPPAAEAPVGPPPPPAP